MGEEKSLLFFWRVVFHNIIKKNEKKHEAKKREKLIFPRLKLTNSKSANNGADRINYITADEIWFDNFILV